MSGNTSLQMALDALREDWTRPYIEALQRVRTYVNEERIPLVDRINEIIDSALRDGDA